MTDLAQIEVNNIEGGDDWSWRDFFDGVGWTCVAVGAATGNVPVAVAGAAIEGALWLTR